MSTSLKRFFGLALVLLLTLPFLLPATPTLASPVQWVVVFNQPTGLPQNVDNMVANAGGTITVRLPEIGAIAATSSNANFAATMARNPLVYAVGEDVVQQLIPEDPGFEPADADNNGGQYSPPGPDPQLMPDHLGREQWDKMRLNATLNGSYAVQPGRRDVVVAVLDTGADVLPRPHPDIAPNLDFARSRSFVDSATGAALPAPDPNPANWDDRHGHGSWCLSAVGAPINSVGVSGVAPNVKLVALKVLGDTGRGSFVGVANALVYAGVNKFDVASMSLGGYINHSEFNAIYVLLNRAVQFARENGVLPVAALANNGADLQDGELFRDVIEVPGELPGVVGVSATGYFNQKAFYSNYGVGMTDVSAPGGSTRDYSGTPNTGLPQPAPYRGAGRVVGAWSDENTGGVLPPNFVEECDPATGQCASYAWVQGTSMATPHVAGVAALIISQYGDFTPNNQNKPHMAPTQVESILQITANNQPCPEPRTVRQGPGVGFSPNLLFEFATCQGATTGGTGDGYTSFFGKGIVDALKAVTYYNPTGPTGP